MRQHTAAFANFICRFGDDKVLLDYAEQIVIPAFTKDTYVRSYGKRSHYHFYDVDLLNMAKDGETPVLVLAGQFIKETELTRHQIFDEKRGLIKDEQSMRSAPSAFFVLILNNHRLIYFPEMPHAPDLNAFRVTAESFLHKRHEEFVAELYKNSREDAHPPTKKSLFEIHPRPTLEVVHLTGAAGIAQFLRRFEKLRSINFHLVKPNDDINAGEILGQVRELSDALKSTNTKLTASSPDGLDIDAAIEAVTEATASGNQHVSVSGVDTDGNALSGNNEKFKLSAEIDNIPPTKKGLIGRLLDKFTQLSTDGAINAPSASVNSSKLTDLTKLL